VAWQRRSFPRSGDSTAGDVLRAVCRRHWCRENYRDGVGANAKRDHSITELLSMPRASCEFVQRARMLVPWPLAKKRRADRTSSNLTGLGSKPGESIASPSKTMTSWWC